MPEKKMTMVMQPGNHENGYTNARHISVLYVDDDLPLLEVSKLYLEDSEDFHVDIVESPLHALDILLHRPYDAVVSDYQMPQMNGIEFLKILRKNYPALPVILFTGKDREEIAITALENGADFFLQKGGEPKSMYAELSHKIRKSVEQYRAEQALLENEIRLRQQIQNASDHIRILDADGRVVCDSPSTSSLFGYPEQFFIGKRPRDFIHPDDRDSTISAFDHIRQGTNAGIPFRFRFRKADGMYIDVESIALNLTGVKGIDGFVVTTWPTPERKYAVQELRANKIKQTS
jgi:PAS domain S-box-containing protein